MYAQIIDDSVGKTLVAASTTEKAIKDELEKTDDVDAAAYVGKVIAERALEKGIKTVIYDSDKYNGTPGNTAAKRMFDAAGVTYVKYEHTGRTLSIDV